MNAMRVLLETIRTGPISSMALRNALKSASARGLPSKCAASGLLTHECQLFRLTNALPHFGQIHSGRSQRGAFVGFFSTSLDSLPAPTLFTCVGPHPHARQRLRWSSASSVDSRPRRFLCYVADQSNNAIQKTCNGARMIIGV